MCMKNTVKKAMNLKKSMKSNMGGLKEGKEYMLLLNYSNKNKNKKQPHTLAYTNAHT